MRVALSLQRELLFLVAWMFFMFVLGAMLGLIVPVLFAGLVVYVIWNLYNLNRLSLWLIKPSKNTPETIGLWDDIFYQLYSLHKQQKKSRKKLTKMLKRFQKSTQALPYATIVLNSENEIEWFNSASRQLFGLRSALDIGQRVDNLIRQPEFITYLTRKEYDKPLEFENNQKKLLLNITGYGGGQYLLSATDITLQTQLDDMRRDFISNASHELRTPITVMSGYIEVLQDSDIESIRFPVDKIYQQTSRMEKIISELIELARLETSTVIIEEFEIDIDALLNEVHSEAISLDQGQHKIELDILPINITGNYSELRTAISNLMTNAIRYTPEGGNIMIRTRSDDMGSYINVEDNGIGISYEHISRLTERFYRVDEGRSKEKGGTGLGLAIVKHILDRHGASLHVQSQLDNGSTFSCYFPHIH